MLTGQVRLDLTTLAPDRMAGRASLLTTVPDGASAALYVGSLAVEPSAVRIIRAHQRRLNLVIEGEPYAVPNWLEAVRSGLPGELVVLP